ncbi:MAG: hypothetical protein L0220_28240, partial [Acidobacteria bacterium]|nr:hypothetical protein [Acidobacteriota bacterium]
MIFGPDRKAGETWTYGPPGEPVLYDAKSEATTVALSVAESLQQEVGVYIEGQKPMKLATLVG